MENKKLEDIAQLTSGFPQFRIDESDATFKPYKMYNKSDFDYDLSKENTRSNDNKIIRTDREDITLLKKGDIIFSLIWGQATIITEFTDGYYYTQGFVKIDPTNKIDSQYLVYLLNEDKDIKKQFSFGLQGSMVVKYTVALLKSITIKKIPNLNNQKLIGQIYFDTLKITSIRKEIIELEKKKIFYVLSKESSKL